MENRLICFNLQSSLEILKFDCFFNLGCFGFTKSISGLIQQMRQEALRGPLGEEGAKWPESGVQE